MRIDAFLLSDAATIAAGKLYVHGGGFTRIDVPGFPIHIQAALTVRLVLTEEELAAPHRFRCTVQDEDGNDVAPPMELEASGGEPDNVVEGEELYVQFALGLGFMFQHPGVHRITLTVDDEIVREMSLPVVKVDLPPPPQPAVPSPPPNRAARRQAQRERRKQ